MTTTGLPSSASGLLAKPPFAERGDLQSGLTSKEARGRLEKIVPNATPGATELPLRKALKKFRVPVLWMLEAAIVLQLVLGKYAEAAINAGLPLLPAALGYSSRAGP